jgi:hypothetical protein
MMDATRSRGDANSPSSFLVDHSANIATRGAGPTPRPAPRRDQLANDA